MNTRPPRPDAADLDFDTDGQARAPRATATANRRGAGFDRTLFAEDLAELLQAGLSVREALAIQARGLPRAADRACVQALSDRLLQGASLSQALAEQPQAFGPVLAALTQASEQTSDLAASLARHARSARRLDALRGQVLSALIYPALVGVVGLAVIGFLLGWVVPSFAGVVDGQADGLSPGARQLIDLGTMLGTHRGALMAALLAGPALLGLGLLHDHSRQWLWQRLAGLPGLRSTLRLLHAGRFFASCSTLTHGGVAAPTALALATPLLLPEARGPMALALQRLRAGEPLAGVLPAGLLGDPVVPRLLEVGQRTGALPATLERIAGLLEARVARRIERLLKLMEPLLMLTIGGLVGLVVLLMYVPLLELSSSLQP